MLNEIIDVTEIIMNYEDEGLMENSDTVLMVSDCKFYFRDRLTGELNTLEYPYIERNYDRLEHTEEEIEQMELCIKTAQEYGFIVE